MCAFTCEACSAYISCASTAFDLALLALLSDSLKVFNFLE